MYLKKTTRKFDDRIYLSIAEGFHDPQKKHTRTRTVQSLGFLDELQKQYPDPIAHFKKLVDEMNEEKKEQLVSLDFNLSNLLVKGDDAKLLGYAPLSKIYHELELDTFFINRQQCLNSRYNLNNIVKLLAFNRILNPSSKKKAWEQKDRFFENTDFSLDDIYHSLSIINKYREAAKLWIHNHIPNRNTELVYYDLTNYYFEIDEQDELRRKGVSKEHRPNPIVQMGLFLDAEGIPITYNLFPGNTNDCETLIPETKNLRRDFGIGRVIVVADKGINTARNCYFTTHNLKNGYVFSQTVRGGHKELKDYVLEQSGYRVTKEGFRIKSRTYPREIELESADSGKFKTRIDEKQVIFYSPDYDRKAKADRAAAVAKARQLVANPSQYKQATSYGAAKYVKNLEFDKKTGEILTVNHNPVFDEAKLREEEKWDGYYAIVTSELKKTDDEVIDIYRGLWKIEESFKVTKSDLEARPVYVTREDHIQAHFLICFISLVILRLLQKRLGGEFSANRIIETLNKAECINLKENFYLLRFRDEIIDALNEKMNIDITKKIMRLGEIKNIFSNVKKVFVPQ